MCIRDSFKTVRNGALDIGADELGGSTTFGVLTEPLSVENGG